MGAGVDFSILGGPPGPFLSIFDGRVVKNRGPRNTPGALAALLASRQSEPGTSAQSHPSTRAGGQDDGS